MFGKRIETRRDEDFENEDNAILSFLLLAKMRNIF